MEFFLEGVDILGSYENKSESCKGFGVLVVVSLSERRDGVIAFKCCVMLLLILDAVLWRAFVSSEG